MKYCRTIKLTDTEKLRLKNKNKQKKRQGRITLES